MPDQEKKGSQYFSISSEVYESEHLFESDYGQSFTTGIAAVFDYEPLFRSSKGFREHLSSQGFCVILGLKGVDRNMLSQELGISLGSLECGSFRYHAGSDCIEEANWAVVWDAQRFERDYQPEDVENAVFVVWDDNEKYSFAVSERE